MKKLSVLIAGALLALTVSGLAAAKLRADGLSQTTATFRVEKDWLKQRVCTGGGDTYSIGRGHYKGTIDFADNQNELDGPFSLRVHWVYNVTAKHGYADIFWRARDREAVDEKRAHGWAHAVLGAGSGNAIAAEGFVNGRINRHYARVLGGMDATFLPNEIGEITVIEGKLGNATNSFPAEVVGRPCRNERPKPGVKLVVKGQISTLDSTAVGVKPRDNAPEQKCLLKQGVSPSTEGFRVGDTVEMACGLLSNGSGGFDNVVLRLKERR
jgi:hypothetical protein